MQINAYICKIYYYFAVNSANKNLEIRNQLLTKLKTRHIWKSIC